MFRVIDGVFTDDVSGLGEEHPNVWNNFQTFFKVLKKRQKYENARSVTEGALQTNFFPE